MSGPGRDPTRQHYFVDFVLNWRAVEYGHFLNALEKNVKRTTILFLIAALAALTACSKSGNEPAANTAQPAAPAPSAAAPAPQGLPPGHPQLSDIGAPPAEAATQQGKVVSVAQVPGYTYLEVETDGRKIWMAASPVTAKAGDTVSWSGGIVMHNFTSKSLKRTFDEIVFLQTVNVVK